MKPFFSRFFTFFQLFYKTDLERGGRVLRSGEEDPHPADAGSKEAEPSVYRTMSGLNRGGCPKVNG